MFNDLPMTKLANAIGFMLQQLFDFLASISGAYLYLILILGMLSLISYIFLFAKKRLMAK